MTNRLKELANNKKWMEIIFTLLILSFPFGSFFLSFSIGFMTVYPYLILLTALAFLSIWMPREKGSNLERFYLLFTIFLLTFALIYFPFVEGKSDAIIDLRSIVLMTLTTWVFISIKVLLGFESWRSIVLFAFKLIFVVIVLFSFFEMLSGWHLAGAFTEAISERGLKDHLIYVPVFLWDNPNSFITYLILIGAGIVLLEPSGKQKKIVVAAVFAVAMVFAIVVQARIGQFAIILAALLYFGNQFLSVRSANFKVRLFYVAFCIGAVTYALATHSIYKDIPRSRLLDIETVKPVYPIPAAARYAYPYLLKPYEPKVTQIGSVQIDTLVFRNSRTERIALVKNGIEFLKESKLLGIGPGQFRYRHNEYQIKFNAFGNNGAHFWLIELVSQYGIVLFGLYLILWFWIFVIALRNIKPARELTIGLLIAIVLFSLVSILPSAFLILDINWIFTIIVVLTAAEFSTKRKALD